jgi:hypothetical protein
LQMPPDFQGQNYTMSTSFSGNSHTLRIAVRLSDDLSIVKFELTWLQSDPVGSVRVNRTDVAPPPELSLQELQAAHAQFSEPVATWAEQQMGHQVGNGECWTLSQQAIDNACGGVAMSPQGLTHGALVYHIKDNPANPLAFKDEIRRGDVIQFKLCKFEKRNSSGQVTGHSQSGAPDHTSIVTGVSPDRMVIYVVHQNVNGNRTVQRGETSFGDLVSGEIKVYRVVWQQWLGDLVL